MLPFSKLFRVRNFLTENFVIFAYSNFKKATTMFNSFGNIFDSQDSVSLMEKE